MINIRLLDGEAKTIDHRLEKNIGPTVHFPVLTVEVSMTNLPCPALPCPVQLTREVNVVISVCLPVDRSVLCCLIFLQDVATH